MHQTYKVVFLLFDGHLTAIFDATKLPQFLVLPIYPGTRTSYMVYFVNRDISVTLLYTMKYTSPKSFIEIFNYFLL